MYPVDSTIQRCLNNHDQFIRLVLGPLIISIFFLEGFKFLEQFLMVLSYVDSVSL